MAGPTVIAAVLLVWALRALGARNAWFAFLVVWVPMAWLGTVSRVVRPQLPGAYHDLHPFERDGRLYERLGVGLAKRLLRRGPLAVFNPDVHLPAERTPMTWLTSTSACGMRRRATSYCSSRRWGLSPMQSRAAGGAPLAGPCCSTFSSTGTR